MRIARTTCSVMAQMSMRQAQKYRLRRVHRRSKRTIISRHKKQVMPTKLAEISRMKSVGGPASANLVDIAVGSLGLA